MNELIVTAILHGLVFTTSIGHINERMCTGAVRAMSGPNWVVSCKNNNISNAGSADITTIITPNGAPYINCPSTMCPSTGCYFRDGVLVCP